MGEHKPTYFTEKLQCPTPEGCFAKGIRASPFPLRYWVAGGPGGGAWTKTAVSLTRKDPSKSPRNLGKLIFYFFLKKHLVHHNVKQIQSQGIKETLSLSSPHTQPSLLILVTRTCPVCSCILSCPAERRHAGLAPSGAWRRWCGLQKGLSFSVKQKLWTQKVLFWSCWGHCWTFSTTRWRGMGHWTPRAAFHTNKPLCHTLISYT